MPLPSNVKHPARYSDGLVPIFALLLRDAGSRSLLDPMAGTGKIAAVREHGYAGRITCNELESGWPAMPGVDSWTYSDAARMPFDDGEFDAIVTSPVYGNRMSDHHDARGASRRIIYTYRLGRKLQPENTGAMQWGPAYCEKHIAIWTECRRVLAPGGLLVLNVSDHIRKGVVQPVSDWHRTILGLLGFDLFEVVTLETSRMRYGANSTVRVPHENVFAFRLGNRVMEIKA